MGDSSWQQTLNNCENIDYLRGEFESRREWRLRKQFLEMNYGSLPMDRLVCLSRCFINIIMYGCSYPAAVMKDVQERSQGIVEEVKAEKKVEAKQKYLASFVKASSEPDTLSSTVSFGASTAVVKNVAPAAEPWASFSPRNSAISKVIHFGHEADSKTLEPAASIIPDDYGFWGGPEVVTGNIPLDEGIDMSTVRVINKSPDLRSQGTNLVNPAPHNQHPKTALSKEECLAAYQKESNPVLQKIRKLAFEVLKRQSKFEQNAKEVLHSAGNHVPVVMDFAVEKVVNNKSVSFLCCVLIEGVEVASEMGPNIKQAKTNACEAALRVIVMPKLEIVQVGDKHLVIKGTSLIQDRHVRPIQTARFDNSRASFARPLNNRKLPGRAVPYYQESNSQLVKRKRNDFKALEDFIVVEQWNPTSAGGAVNILKQSADFNRMLLEYDYFNQGMATRCVVKIEGEVVADVLDSSKPTSKIAASAQCLQFLRSHCWVLKTKQAVDSTTSISKEEIQKEIQLKSNQISSDNIGSKMLQKMGWSGGGVGKEGTGISEPVSLVSVINRQGLGLSAEYGITGDFRQRMKEVIETYASSDCQEDLAFSSEFSIEERKIIHDESRKLNLRSVSRGKGQNRYLCVSRKRSANQLFEHVMACGGETAKYKLFPPGTYVPDTEDQLEFGGDVPEKM
ncbi:unnamed protein product [Candidula unifasciata]|uniref:NF-kappa-B-repressing factor n=1 Tax=Candidula unifasciata TaxID=100452 RepID=A0A8S3ZK28_9EUPU|nr:unnamed protein product [Candidula unifasciata]